MKLKYTKAPYSIYPHIIVFANMKVEKTVLVRKWCKAQWGECFGLKGNWRMKWVVDLHNRITIHQDGARLFAFKTEAQLTMFLLRWGTE